MSVRKNINVHVYSSSTGMYLNRSARVFVGYRIRCIRTKQTPSDGKSC